jgi:proteasome accessory factor B
VPEQYDNLRSVSAEERLLCLVLALLPSERGMSKNDIFSNVRGYRDEFLRDGATEALNRKFDRDKDDLKSLGIPLRTSETENPADAVYFIPSHEYTFQFDERELALLTAAGAVWSESAHSTEVREASVRLAAADADGDDLSAYAPRIAMHEGSYSEFAKTIADGTVVSFPYLKPGEAKYEQRVVSPLALTNYDGRWHLLAYDHNRDAERTFLLRRVVGKVSPLKGAPLRRPDASTQADFHAHLDELWGRLTATIRVTPKSKAAGVLRNRRDTEVAGNTYTVHYLDEAVFADELCEYGAEAIVLEPASLRAAVIERLERLVSDHA